MFYSNNLISTSTFPQFFTDITQENRGDAMQYSRIRQLYSTGSWNDGVFTTNSLNYRLNSALLLTKDNYTAYTVSNNYTPAHKKYVDDAIANKIWIGTQAEYDALSSYSDSTLYFIKEIS